MTKEIQLLVWQRPTVGGGGGGLVTEVRKGLKEERALEQPQKSSHVRISWKGVQSRENGKYKHPGAQWTWRAWGTERKECAGLWWERGCGVGGGSLGELLCVWPRVHAERTLDIHRADSWVLHLSQVSLRASEQFSVTKAHIWDMCAVRLIWQGVSCFVGDWIWLTTEHPHFSLLLLSFTPGLIHRNICDMIDPSFCGENKVAQCKAKPLSSIFTV